MVQVIEIKQSKRNKERFMVFTNDGEAYKLADETIIKAQIKVGQEYEEEQLKELAHEDETRWASAAALGYLKYRQRSEREITDYLRKKEYKDDTIEKVIDKLTGYGYINDQMFANEWVRAKTATKGQGKQRLKRDLRQKGISDEEIAQALDTYSETQEIENALRLAEKVYQQNKAQEELTIKRKIANKLAYQGFSWETINCVTKQVFKNDDDLY